MSQQNEFYIRLSRLPQPAVNTDLLLGPSRARNVDRNQRLSEMTERYQRGPYGDAYKPRAALPITPVVSYFFAFALGVMAAFIARFLRFQVEGVAHGAPDLNLIIDVVFAISVAFLVRELLSLSAVKRMGAQFAGILLALITMHNVVHMFPQAFEKTFSSEWVEHVTSTTQAGTLHVLGRDYDL